MKQKLLLVLSFMLVTLGLQAEEYSYTFTKTTFTANGTVELAGFNWTLAGTGGNHWGLDSNGKGQQFGAKDAKAYTSMTLSTSDIPGTITKIVLNTSGASGITGTVTVTVGGTQFGEQVTLTKTATDYTFEGSASGEIVFSYTQTSKKALYIKSIAVTYTTGESVPTAKPALTSSCSFYGEQEVTISCATDGAIIYYTTDGTEPTENDELKYTESFTVTETTTVKAIAVSDKGTSEVAEATYTEVEPVKVTIAEFLAAAEDETWYELTGEIINIAKEDYGNFTIKDETGEVYIYGMTSEWVGYNDKSFSKLGLKVGDVVTLGTLRGSYKETPQGGGNKVPAFFISRVAIHVHSASVFTAEGASIKAACECGESCGSLTLVVPSDLVYNGQAKAVTVEGTIEGVETPEVVYSSEAAPVNAGTYTASITLGEVTATVEYTIAAKSIEGAVAGEFAEMTYTGEAQTPVAVVTLDGVEVTGSWSEVLNVGDKSTFTANGNFTGTLEAEVGMKAKDIAGAVVGEFTEMTYNGAAQTPAAVVTIEGVGEVTGSWSEVTNVGDKSTFTANGNFTGSLEAEVGMKAKDIAGAVVGEFTEMTYNGAAQTPAAVVTIEGVGEVTGSWSEVTNVGDKSTFTANGNFTGSLEAEVGMKAKELEETDVVLETKSVEYTGEAIKPAVTVTSGDATLVEGTDYDVTYSDNVEVGEATVTVTAKGNYSGTIVVKFVIEVPASIAPVQSQTEVVYYDLCGRRVQQPLKGKIYIANGKKVIF